MYSAIATFSRDFIEMYIKTYFKVKKNKYVYLIVPGEVKFEFADFNVKLSSVLFFLKPGSRRR